MLSFVKTLLIASVTTIILIVLSINLTDGVNFELLPTKLSFLKEMVGTKKLSILCLVMTRPDGKDMQDAIIETWGPGCTDLVFFIGDKNASEDLLTVLKPHIFKLILAVEDAWGNTWMKVRAAMKFVNTSWSDHYDWVLRIDDDAYVIFDNMRQLLSNFNSSMPVQVGAHYAHYIGGYIGTGPGIAISRAAFHDLMQSFNNDSFCNTNLTTHNDDAELGVCLKKANVPYGNSSDSLGRLRFIPIRLHELLEDRNSSKYDSWFASASAYPVQPGLKCCSDDLISLHYIDKDVMRRIHVNVQANPEKPKNLRLIAAGSDAIYPIFSLYMVLNEYLVMSFALLFVYRCVLIVHWHEVDNFFSRKKIALAFFILFLICLLNFVLQLECYREKEVVVIPFNISSTEPVESTTSIANEEDGKIVLSALLIVAFVIAIGCINGSYFLIFYCRRKILLYLRNRQETMSEVTRSAHILLIKVLTAQAALPVVTLMPLTLTAVLTLTIGHVNPVQDFIANVIYSWIPFIDPLSTIWFVRPYRRTICPCISRVQVDTRTTANQFRQVIAVSR